MKKMKNLISAMLVLTMVFTFALPSTVEAASTPKKTKITSLKSPAAGKVTVKYSKVKGAKYQIQAATNSKMTKGKKTYKTSAASKTMSLTKGKKYYVRIRTYKKVNGKTKYSKWSAKKSVTVRKTGSAHIHSYTIPVTEKRTVMVQVPFSQAKYPKSGEFNYGTKDYYKIEYYYKANNAANTEICMDNYSDSEFAAMIASGKEDWVGWVEKRFERRYVCQKCGRIYGKDEDPMDDCHASYRTDSVVIETIEHKATPTTQTVTIGKKCSCGKIQYY